VIATALLARLHDLKNISIAINQIQIIIKSNRIEQAVFGILMDRVLTSGICYGSV